VRDDIVVACDAQPIRRDALQVQFAGLFVHLRAIAQPTAGSVPVLRHPKQLTWPNSSKNPAPSFAPVKSASPLLQFGPRRTEPPLVADIK
jgi:hypothetical protein